jgi:hypothetical protein
MKSIRIMPFAMQVTRDGDECAYNKIEEIVVVEGDSYPITIRLHTKAETPTRTNKNLNGA